MVKVILPEIPEQWVNIIAYLHHKDGKYEICTGKVEVNKSTHYDKNALLAHICNNRWGHEGPLAAIGFYLRHTKSYAQALQYPGMFGNSYEIHFYEKGADRDNKNVFSCREVFAMRDEIFDDHLQSTIQKVKVDGLDVRVY